MQIVVDRDTIRYYNSVVRHPKRKLLEPSAPHGAIPGGIGSAGSIPVSEPASTQNKNDAKAE